MSGAWDWKTMMEDKGTEQAIREMTEVMFVKKEERLPTPFYEDEFCTLFCGDCREILPKLAIADLLLTDPPYGIKRDGMRASTSRHGGRKPYEFLDWDKSAPDKETFALMFAQAKNQIIWGANYFTSVLPPKMGWLFWDKGQRISSSDGELAFTSFASALRVIELNRVELMLDGAAHPTQKPLKLMTWCIAHADKHQTIETILDPFAGSGTTGVAAKQLGRKSILIELEEKYCTIAADRLRNTTPSLFAPTPPKHVQEALFLEDK